MNAYYAARLATLRNDSIALYQSYLAGNMGKRAYKNAVARLAPEIAQLAKLCGEVTPHDMQGI